MQQVQVLESLTIIILAWKIILDSHFGNKDVHEISILVLGRAR